MTEQPKSKLMARLRARRQREGLVQLNVWAHRDDVAKVRQYAARLLKRRTDSEGGST